MVAREDLFAQIAGIGAQPPLMHAVIATKGSSATGRYLEVAPAAERQSIWTFWQIFYRSAAARKSAGYKHRLSQDRLDELVKRLRTGFPPSRW